MSGRCLEVSGRRLQSGRYQEGMGHSKHSKQDVSWVLQGCLLGVPRVFKRCCSNSNPRVFKGCFKEVSRKFQKNFKGVSRNFQGCFKEVSRVSQGSFNFVLRVF